ncbi:MAG: RHS repeat-associated core domain-containing protein [Aquisalinus sp.]|nr:RHS repeat-associated core domain-containing protein [Aquisalinus sp.]
MDGKTIYSVYDASGALVLRDNITDNERTDYISIPGGSVRVKNVGAGSSGSGTLSWVHKDHLGSPVVEANASGTLQWRERYSPYGEKLNSVAGNLDRPAFTGHIHDDASGLTYMQARFYDPVIGRFLSIDPVGFVESGEDPRFFNRYVYTFNDPVNLTDPTGRNPAIDRRADAFAALPAEDKLAIGSVVADFTPIIGSIKGGAEFANDPSLINAVGIIPYGKILKRGKQVGDIIDSGGTTKASDIIAKAEEVGFTRSQTKNGPLKFKDENGVDRVTIKSGSARTQGSEGPHVELRRSDGQRVNPAGDPVTRKSPENHTPIIDDRN